MIRTCVSTILTLIASFVFAGVAGWADNTRPNGAPADDARAVRTSTTAAREAAVKLDGFAPTSELGTVHFDFDKAVIRPTEARALDQHAQWLKANSGAMVAVDGGADQRGSVVYNQRLSERRAKAVKDYLVARGVAADRIATLGYGEGLLACRATGEACWQKNRRADFLVKVLDKQSP
jgi:outer membrane protein OmpA-like peptidoglycan-associated protein